MGCREGTGNVYHRSPSKEIRTVGAEKAVTCIRVSGKQFLRAGKGDASRPRVCDQLLHNSLIDARKLTGQCLRGWGVNNINP